MEKVDFFSDQYKRESPRRESLFGIVDGVEQGQGRSVAYTDVENSDSWNAIVKNEPEASLTFEPLDHNIVVKPTSTSTYSLCDGMLYDDRRRLIFVELKVKEKDWVSKSVEQLRSTIELFCKNHDYDSFSTRVAYAANKKHPCFHFSHKERMSQFFKETHFRLLIQNTIDIK